MGVIQRFFQMKVDAVEFFFFVVFGGVNFLGLPSFFYCGLAF